MTATINIDDGNLKQGLLGLTTAILEIVVDSLKIQAVKRMESGRLTDAEVERLGAALQEMDRTLDELKTEHGIAETTRSVRASLDDAANEVLDKMINPERWVKCGEEGGDGK